MIKVLSLGVLVLGLGLAAGCSSNDPPADGRGGTGGSPSTGAGGKGGAGGAAGGAAGHGGGTAGSGAGGAGKGGDGGARACESWQCLRPYQCRRSCAGPVEYTGCCACEPPLFDDFGSTACGGTGGAIGGSGGGSAGRGGGTAGGGGSARGGSGGSVAGSGGSARGGSGGSGGAGGGCVAMGLCARPYECRLSCDTPVHNNGCCPCQAPQFDDFLGRVCGDGGVGTASYGGCSYIGGFDRLSITKMDPARDLCLHVGFVEPSTTQVAGLTLWGGRWGVEEVSAGPAAACATRSLLTRRGGSVTGTVTAPQSTTSPPQSLSFDLVVTFPADGGAAIDERMTATNVATAGGNCSL